MLIAVNYSLKNSPSSSFGIFPIFFMGVPVQLVLHGLYMAIKLEIITDWIANHAITKVWGKSVKFLVDFYLMQIIYRFPYAFKNWPKPLQLLNAL